jgi:uncharacterized phage-associated protein
VAVSASAIANGLLSIAEQRGEQITPMKLQKLAYYAHGWHLALRDRPLFLEGVEAWRMGPVIRSIWVEFKSLGSGPITKRARQIRLKSDGAGAKKASDLQLEVYEPSIALESKGDYAAFVDGLLERIWTVYGKYTAIQLSNMTHEEGGPWSQIYRQFNGSIPRGMLIPDDLIKEHFKRRLKTGPVPATS